jgi:hypothetical protein
MEPTFLMSALQSLASAPNSGGDCRCRCGGRCCDQIRDHSQQLAHYLTRLGGTFADTGTDYPASRR